MTGSGPYPTYDELEALYLEHPETCDCEFCQAYTSIEETHWEG